MQGARHLFSNTGIKLTTDGQCHLGAAIGTSNFRTQYITEKSGNERLTDIAKTQPHAAYSAFTHDINIVNIPTL